MLKALSGIFLRNFFENLFFSVFLLTFVFVCNIIRVNKKKKYVIIPTKSGISIMVRGLQNEFGLYKDD